MKADVQQFVEDLVLTVHRRNGGSSSALDAKLRLLDPALGIDSLDLAEIMAGLEKRFHVSPFDGDKPPGTWVDVIQFYSDLPA